MFTWAFTLGADAHAQLFHCVTRYSAVAIDQLTCPVGILRALATRDWALCSCLPRAALSGRTHVSVAQLILGFGRRVDDSRTHVRPAHLDVFLVASTTRLWTGTILLPVFTHWTFCLGTGPVLWLLPAPFDGTSGTLCTLAGAWLGASTAAGHRTARPVRPGVARDCNSENNGSSLVDFSKHNCPLQGVWFTCLYLHNAGSLQTLILVYHPSYFFAVFLS